MTVFSITANTKISQVESKTTSLFKNKKSLLCSKLYITSINHWQLILETWLRMHLCPDCQKYTVKAYTQKQQYFISKATSTSTTTI